MVVAEACLLVVGYIMLGHYLNLLFCPELLDSFDHYNPPTNRRPGIEQVNERIGGWVNDHAPAFLVSEPTGLDPEDGVSMAVMLEEGEL